MVKLGGEALEASMVPSWDLVMLGGETLEVSKVSSWDSERGVGAKIEGEITGVL